MDIKDIKSLIELLENSNLTALEVEENQTKIRLEKSKNNIIEHIEESSKISNNIMIDNHKGIVDYNNLYEVTSPMVGIFYSSSTPNKPPYVNIGSRVKKGDVLCIIEAMKIMNEIISEKDGEIIDICVKNEQVVEYSQVLFKIQ